jgi:Tat protein secretion system quality control protein TatD with DNase activity
LFWQTGFGIHPWKAPEVKSDWQIRLEKVLIDNPQSFCGEFGLGIVSFHHFPIKIS